ncbi:hypothetical protein EDB81DRAFT_894822 [Dactylonectria macrodidyma]|uniref:Uncharacterized protein n=1 Tax=Dactylonectria macrodidyma TaxID=307937 RepID=A0A9P9I715_9HYPO|nr:hypothetical protein EDB81DRAFT_894822 [Dactylonectria macrodidyma]
MNVSVGDIAAIATLAWTVYRRYKKSAKEGRDISDDVSNIGVILSEIDEDLKEDRTSLNSHREKRLLHLVDSADKVIRDLQREIGRYDSLKTTTQKKFEILRFAFKDVSSMRQRIINTTTNLVAFEVLLLRLVHLARLELSR